LLRQAIPELLVNPFKFLFRIYDVMDAVVFAASGLLAAAVLVVAPVFLIYRLFAEGRYVVGGLSAFIWLAFASACVRDVWRRRFGWASALLFGGWLALTIGCGWHA
jgi:hypothetical protein